MEWETMLLNTWIGRILSEVTNEILWKIINFLLWLHFHQPNIHMYYIRHFQNMKHFSNWTLPMDVDVDIWARAIYKIHRNVNAIQKRHKLSWLRSVTFLKKFLDHVTVFLLSDFIQMRIAFGFYNKISLILEDELLWWCGISFAIYIYK